MEKIEKNLKRLGRRTLQVYQECDRIATQTAKTAKTTCTKGCDHCCHLLTIVTLPEAAAIAEHLLTDPAWRPKLAALLVQLYEQLLPLSDPALTRESYFDQHIPCVFLGADRTCGIYDVRPTACRYHFVVTDPKHCAYDAEDRQVGRLDLRALEARVWQDSSHISSQVGVLMVAGPMQIALLGALKLLDEGLVAFMSTLRDRSLGPLSLTYWMQLMVSSDTPFVQSVLAATREQLSVESSKRDVTP